MNPNSDFIEFQQWELKPSNVAAVGFLPAEVITWHQERSHLYFRSCVLHFLVNSGIVFFLGSIEQLQDAARVAIEHQVCGIIKCQGRP